MANYLQFTNDKRFQIYELLKADPVSTFIVIVVGMHKSTISREILRNTGGRGYRPIQAQSLCDGVNKVSTLVVSQPVIGT